MGRLIDEAISARLDGLVVSLPDIRALRAPIRRALKAGIPVVSINSGSDRFRDLGIRVHVGQPEWRAGFESGRRMARAGVRHGLCVNQETGNEGVDQRCRGFSVGMRRRGGRASQISVDGQDAARAQQADLRCDRAARRRRRDVARHVGQPAGAEGGPGGRVRPRREARDVRPHARDARGGADQAGAVRGRPAAVPARATRPSCCSPNAPATASSPPAGRSSPPGRSSSPRSDVTDELIELSRRGLR